MNRLEKENLKKSVPFEELRDLRQACFNLESTDADTAFKAARSLASLVSISNCEIVVDQDAVSATVSFIQNSTCDGHICAACDLLLSMFPHELELVQERILKVCGVQILEAARTRFPNSTIKIVKTLRQCVYFFNAGQNIARTSGVLLSILDLDRASPDEFDTKSCLDAMCYLNGLNTAIVHDYGFHFEDKIVQNNDGPEFELELSQKVPQTSGDFPLEGSAASWHTLSTRSRSSLNQESECLPFEVGAQLRAIKSLKESFAADKSGQVNTAVKSSSKLLKKSLQRSHLGSERTFNPLQEHESSTLNAVAARILGPRRFMDVIKRADAILKRDIPETKTSEVFGPQNYSLKTHGRISEEAWSCVRYVEHVPRGDLGTMYGQQELTFLKWFYAGQMMGNEAHGNGVFRWVNGSKYAGQIKHNKRHGLGKMVFDTADMSMASDLCTSSGTTYFGHWEADKIHGIGVFFFLPDDGGGSLCGIFDQGKITPYAFSEEVLPENFIETVHFEDRKADTFSAEAIQNASSTIFRHNYESNDGHFLFPLHYTPQRALIQRPGARGEETTSIKMSK